MPENSGYTFEEELQKYGFFGKSILLDAGFCGLGANAGTFHSK
jgi:hypothetical protein